MAGPHGGLFLAGQYRAEYLLGGLHDDPSLVRGALEQGAGELLRLFQLDMRR